MATPPLSCGRNPARPFWTHFEGNELGTKAEAIPTAITTRGNERILEQHAMLSAARVSQHLHSTSLATATGSGMNTTGLTSIKLLASQIQPNLANGNPSTRPYHLPLTALLPASAAVHFRPVAAAFVTSKSGGPCEGRDALSDYSYVTPWYFLLKRDPPGQAQGEHVTVPLRSLDPI